MIISNASTQYTEYLKEHIKNVKKAFEWIRENLPDVVSEDNCIEERCYYGTLPEIISKHDESKFNSIPKADAYYDLTCEYDAYAEYFYGRTQTDEIKEAFDRAWLSHIHANPHHWQHWILQNDEDGLKILDMPYVFIVEMICDWWSFSWKSGNIHEIFNWYNKNEKVMLLSDKTRKTVENILTQIKNKLGDN